MRATDFPEDASWRGFEEALRRVEAPAAPEELLAECLGAQVQGLGPKVQGPKSQVAGPRPPASPPSTSDLGPETLDLGPEILDRTPTILVVDDEPRIRQLIRLHLERAGWEVEEAVDGVAALARVPELRPDLVVLDVMMPGPSGFDVVTVLKSDPRTTDILVVMLTARDDYDDIRRGWNRGADCYFCKPFNPWELTATIGRMLAVRGTPEEPAPLRPWLK